MDLYLICIVFDAMIIIYYDESRDTFNPQYSDEDIKRRAIQHSRSVIRRNTTTSSYARDRYVNEYAKRRAHGICQLCGNPAPFIDKNGKPYLEVHHVIPLADGGDDSIDNTVALCPNCHRKMHSLTLQEDVDWLLKVAGIHGGS